MNHFVVCFPVSKEEFSNVTFFVPCHQDIQESNLVEFKSIPLSLWDHSLILRKMATQMDTKALCKSVVIQNCDADTFTQLCTLFTKGIVDFSNELEVLVDYLDLTHCILHRSREKDCDANFMVHEDKKSNIKVFEKDYEKLNRMANVTFMIDPNLAHIPTVLAKSIKSFMVSKSAIQISFNELRPMNFLADIFVTFSSQQQVWDLATVGIEIVSNDNVVWKEVIFGAHIIVENLIPVANASKKCLKIPFSRFSRPYLYFLQHNDWNMKFSFEWNTFVENRVSLTFVGHVIGPQEFEQCCESNQWKPVNRLYKRLTTSDHAFNKPAIPSCSNTLAIDIATSDVSNPFTTTCFSISKQISNESIRCFSSFQLFVMTESNPLYFFEQNGPVKFVQIEQEKCEIAYFDPAVVEKRCGFYTHEFFFNGPHTTLYGYLLDQDMKFSITTVNEPGKIYLIQKGTNGFTDPERIDLVEFDPTIDSEIVLVRRH